MSGGWVAGADGGQRAAVMHCPYCGEQDLRPVEEPRGAWRCRDCVRVFTVRFVGLAREDLAASTQEVS
ncbi:hypothetical protein MM440_01660 [Arsenicicoccus piscis]|uniref:Insertion element protein n=1 Tax=Arsenicicoccus piscis TaxID=673954 RepID=A0ABQ6HRR9_9MICO|nr:hypothetical protein [Arsenicicoccus piscis]MCH8626519.1 hypothetical protein [Arsenicicoccus piscis]GMA21160.1 hypothetical protein GCM10025862_31810 [Arsenicicoccus piscis]